MSWFQNQLPSGPGTAAFDSERDRVEADEQGIVEDQEHVRDSDNQRRGRGSTHPYGHDEVEQASLRERQTNVAGAAIAMRPSGTSSSSA
jgi:hypothetical protein